MDCVIAGKAGAQAGLFERIIMDKYELILGDCLPVMQSMEAGSVDAVITDPPYGMKFIQNSGRMKQLGYREIIGDDSTLDLSKLLEIGRLQIIFGGNFFVLPISRGWIVWDKQNGKKVDYGDCELIWTSMDVSTRIITHVWDGFLRDSDKGISRDHPSQKPIGLMKRLIEDYTNKNDCVFDPFMGSGTTGVACMQLGRRFIGCEIDPKYFAIAEKRIKAAASQEIMF